MTQFLFNLTEREIGNALETAKIKEHLAADTGLNLFLWALEAAENGRSVATVDGNGTVTELVLPYWMR